MKKYLKLMVFLLLLFITGCDNKVEKIKKGIEIQYLENDTSKSVTKSFYVPLEVDGYKITWETGSPYLEIDGDRVIIEPTTVNTNATLSASFVYKGKTHSVHFIITLIGVDEEQLPFDDTIIKNQINIPTETKSDIFLPTLIDGITITWVSSDEDIISNTGVVTPQNENVVVSLKASFEISVGNKTIGETIIVYFVTVIGENSGSFDFTDIIAQIEIPTETETNILLPTLIDGVDITWVSSNEDIISNTGVVRRPTNDTLVSLVAKLKKGSSEKNVLYTIKVLKTDLIDYEAILNQINLPFTTNNNLVLPNIINDVNITWESNNEFVITNYGVITQGSTDITVTLKATAGDKEKLFTVTVLKLIENNFKTTKTPIIEVRELPNETQTEIHGVVTSLMTNGCFTIQDDTGAIAVYFGNTGNDALEVGKEYIISGKVGDFAGLKQLISPTIKETIGIHDLPPVIDLTGYSLNYDDVILYESHVITYLDLEVINIETSTNSITLTVKNEAGETVFSRLDTRVNDTNSFQNIEIGKIINLYNVSVGQYGGVAQLLFTKRSTVEARTKNPDLVNFYGVTNRIHVIGDIAPDFLEGITAKDGHNTDFTHLLTYNDSNINLEVAGEYIVVVYLSSDETIKTTYKLTVREPIELGNYTGYYESLSGLTGDTLNKALKNLIQSRGFATGSTSQVQKADKWNGSYYLIYTGLGPYGNREHTWPRSLLGSAPNDDLHNLRACNSSVNSSRGNLPFREDDRPFTGSQPYGKFNGGWYPGDEHIGDVARIVLYIHVRYNLSLGAVGNLDMFLTWHNLDPVDDFERARNDRIYNIQENRNPFIDHPELVSIYFGSPKTSFDIPLSLISATLAMNEHYNKLIN